MTAEVIIIQERIKFEIIKVLKMWYQCNIYLLEKKIYKYITCKYNIIKKKLLENIYIRIYISININKSKNIIWFFMWIFIVCGKFFIFFFELFSFLFFFCLVYIF